MEELLDFFILLPHISGVSTHEGQPIVRRIYFFCAKKTGVQEWPDSKEEKGVGVQNWTLPNRAQPTIKTTHFETDFSFNALWDIPIAAVVTGPSMKHLATNFEPTPRNFIWDPNRWTSCIQTSYLASAEIWVWEVEYSRISISRSLNSSSIRWSLFRAGAQSCCISCMIIEWFSTI